MKKTNSIKGITIITLATLLGISVGLPVRAYEIGPGMSTEEEFNNWFWSDFQEDNPDINMGPTTTTPTTPVATPAPTPAPAPKEEVKPCEHVYESEVTKQATCGEEGERTFACTLCGDSYTEPVEKSTVHGYEKEITKEPTCTEPGEAVFTCSICGDSYTEEVEPSGHDYIAKLTKEPTCTEAGENTYTCTVCGDSYTAEVPAMGHKAGDWEITTAASWFSAGEQVKRCTVCGEILETQEIPSQYPLWYLFVGIGAAVVVIGAVAGIVVYKKRKS